MTYWLRVRRTGTTLALTYTGVILAGDMVLPLPNFLGGATLQVPLAFLLPLAVSITLARGLTNGDHRLEGVAGRNLRRLDLLYAFAVAAVCEVAAFAADRSHATPHALACGRNSIGYIALTVIGLAVLGPQAAALPPVVWALAASLFGSTYGGIRGWAWPIAAADDTGSWMLVLTLIVAGAVAWPRAHGARSLLI